MEILTDSLLITLPGVHHAFFTRHGGVSKGIYESLNCAYYTGDTDSNIVKNRTIALATLGRSTQNLVTLNNLHGNRVIVVDKPLSNATLPKADGMVTSAKEIVLGAVSADCPIILFADDINRVIGSAHAGWRGAREGVLEATIDAMLTLGADISAIKACVSPCIAAHSYEVGIDFYNAFVHLNSSNINYFTVDRHQHIFFDLRAYVNDRLAQKGIATISHMRVDTYSDARFFSCRRSQHQHQQQFGCHFSCIYQL